MTAAHDPTPPAVYLTTDQVAQLAGVSRHTVNDWVRTGKLPSVARGKSGYAIGYRPHLFDPVVAETFARHYRAARQQRGQHQRVLTPKQRGWPGLSTAADQLGVGAATVRQMAAHGWLTLETHGGYTHVEPAGLRVLRRAQEARGVPVPPEWLSLAESMAALGVSSATVNRAVKAGRCRSLRCGPWQFYHRDDIARLAEDWPVRGFSSARARELYRRYHRGGESVAALAQAFGLSVGRATAIVEGRTWAWATGHKRQRRAA